MSDDPKFFDFAEDENTVEKQLMLLVKAVDRQTQTLEDLTIVIMGIATKKPLTPKVGK